MNLNRGKRVSKGFTLIEVMIVVGIIGILAAIAFPNYQQYVLRSHRVDARNMLLDAAQKLQQNYSVSRSWNKLNGSVINATPAGTIDPTLASWGLSRSPASGNLRYKINIRSIDENGYVLEAVPQGAQTKDECKTFTISSRNEKTADGKNSRDPLSIKCWRS